MGEIITTNFKQKYTEDNEKLIFYNYDSFLEYCTEHESELRIINHDGDFVNKDGKLVTVDKKIAEEDSLSQFESLIPDTGQGVFIIVAGTEDKPTTTASLENLNQYQTPILIFEDDQYNPPALIFEEFEKIITKELETHFRISMGLEEPENSNKIEPDNKKE